MVRRSLSLFLALTLSISIAGAPKRRAGIKPAIDPSTAAGWLTTNAHFLVSTELTPYSYDLEVLEPLIGSANTVGLGDVTHGSHELYTVKLRIIDYLVREMNFTVIGIEGPFALFERINQYALGGPGDGRALLKESADRLSYFFWNVEEMLAVIEWVRAYNLSRGDKPPVEIAGFDIYDYQGAATALIAYLQRVDPAEGARLTNDYRCALETTTRNESCRLLAAGAYDRIAAKRDAYIAASSVREYDDALQYATIMNQAFGDQFTAGRDLKMAANVMWIRGHRGTTGKTILWAHQEHIGEIESPILFGKSMGTLLAESLGANYFTIGTMSGNMSYRYTTYDSATRTYGTAIGTFTPLAGSYESFFTTRGVHAMLIPLDGNVPAWLTGPAAWNTAGTTAVIKDRKASLPAMLDAVVYVETTTPTRPLN